MSNSNLSKSRFFLHTTKHRPGTVSLSFCHHVPVKRCLRNHLNMSEVLLLLKSHSKSSGRWTVIEEDNHGGSLSNWTPVKRSCFSTKNAQLAEKMVCLFLFVLD